MSPFARRHFMGSLGVSGALSQENTCIEKEVAGFATAGTGASGNDAAPHREA
jgi:hypothetical protein